MPDTQVVFSLNAILDTIRKGGKKVDPRQLLNLINGSCIKTQLTIPGFILKIKTDTFKTG